MNNNVTPEKKSGVLNTLAIIGLLGIVVLIAWLSVQLVNLFPSAVTSLASLADSVYSEDPTKVVEVEKNIIITSTNSGVNSGANFVISWANDAESGQYTFSYQCEEGVSLSIETATNKFNSADCNNSYNLGLVDTVVLVIDSEKNAEVNLTYTISYFKENSLSKASSVSKTVLVENPRLVIDETATSTEEVVEETPSTPVTSTPLPPAPVYEYEYAIPVSNPNGFTDLVVTYLGIGTQNSAGIFSNTGLLTRNVKGAFQFSVKNVGTKTSEKWTFEADLPGGGSYESNDLNPLKPNERTTITIGFPAVSDRGLEGFGIEVSVDEDTNQRNNDFDWSVEVR